MATVRHSAAEVARAAGLAHAPTPEQTAVIEAPLRPMLVVAGAGSGKTETMAARVVWLVAIGSPPIRCLGYVHPQGGAAEPPSGSTNGCRLQAGALDARA
jgi:DNA helicase-2/ATP-dependent DNA helicase PcrA